MLSRPGGRSSQSGRGAVDDLRHAVVDASVDAAEHEQVAGAEHDVDERARFAGPLPAMRKTPVSPRLMVTTGAVDGSSPSWCRPSRAPGAYRFTIAASGANGSVGAAPGGAASTTARNARSTNVAGIGFTGAPSVSSAVREYT